jgi:hypothetical protein
VKGWEWGDLRRPDRFSGSGQRHRDGGALRLGERSNFERSVPQRGTKLRSESRFLERKTWGCYGEDGAWDEWKTLDGLSGSRFLREVEDAGERPIGGVEWTVEVG